MIASYPAAARRLVLLAVAFLSLRAAVASAAPEKNLHYLMVDRSYSIETNRLIESITAKVKNVVNDLGAADEVRIVFFSTDRGGEMKWPSMTLDAKVDFAKHFKAQFKPDHATHLYDTADAVLDEVLAVADRYAEIKIHIFSDGDDSANGTIRTWDPIVEKACRLIRTHPNGLVSMYTVGFTPLAMPADCIRVVRVEKDEPRVPPPPPRADFEAAPREVLVGEEVTYFAKQSPGAVSSLEWSFGDGGTASGTLESHQVVKHVYTKPGAQTVSLVAAGIGGRDDEVKAGYIVVREPARPVARFSWLPEAPRAGDAIGFVNESAGQPDGYRWNLGVWGASTVASPRVTAAAPGTQVVELVALKGGMSHTARASVVVLALPPNAAFDLDPKDRADLGQAVRMTATAKESGLRHEWRLGDGASIGTGPAATWTPPADGAFELVHEVAGPGGSATARKTVVVNPTEKPDADFTIHPEPVELGGEVTVAAAVTKPGWEHRWTVGEKTYDGSTVTLRPAAAGALPVTHEVTHRDQRATLQKTISVIEVARVMPRFSASSRSGKRPLEVRFRDRTDGEVTAYHWDFGDGTTSRDKGPVHTYSNAGVYRVTLAVENKFGHRTEGAESETIHVKNPIPPVVWAAVAGLALLAGAIWAFLKTRPVPPGGKLQWAGAEGGLSRPIEVTGTRFALERLKIPDWKADGVYEIAVRGGRRVLLKDGEVNQELGRDKRFRIGGVGFRYTNDLLSE
jgi:PKD repeat protein